MDASAAASAAASWALPVAHAFPAALTALSVRQLAGLVTRGDVSAEEIVLAHLHRIAEVDHRLGALVHVDAERAVDDARRIDRRRGQGRRLGRLAGVPFVVKDNIDVRGHATTCGSHAAENVLALRDATAVARLRDAGAVVLGRANMDEFAMGGTTATSAFGVTRNPWDERRSPGGSSGGSAAAVAAGLAAFAIGTDTGGSIREPAAQCGVVGLAPSHGVVPTSGMVPFAPELDRLGPFARSASDAALLLAVLTGRPDLPIRRRAQRRLRVGVVAEVSGPRNAPGVLARFRVVLDALAAGGADIVVVSVPDAADALPAYLVISSAACVSTLSPYLRTGRVGPEVLRRVDAASRRTTDDLDAAATVRRRLAADTARALSRVDVLVSPTMPTTAPLLSQPGYADCWTVAANLAGVPALSLPAGLSTEDGMPVGVMVSARAGADRLVLAVATRLESAGLAHLAREERRDEEDRGQHQQPERAFDHDPEHAGCQREHDEQHDEQHVATMPTARGGLTAGR